MAVTVKGADVALSIKDDIRLRLSDLKNKGMKPKLMMIGVGDDPANASYERGIVKVFNELEIENEKTVLDEHISQDDFDKAFTKINEDDSITGILVFRPLPNGLSTEFAAKTIKAYKDIDCMGYYSQAALAMGKKDGFGPCTAEAVVRFLDYEKIDLAFKNVVVIGRSVVVGRPLVSMLISRNATVTCCHTKTRDLTERITNADIVVTAAGSRGLLKGEMLKNASADVFCIDVGINMREDGKGICGDIDFESTEPVCKKITTVPGGVGSVTSTILAEHVLRGAEMMFASGKGDC